MDLIAETTTDLENQVKLMEAKTVALEAAFEFKQRMLKPYLTSEFVPKHHRKMDNLIICDEMARHRGLPILLILQNTYIVHGTPCLAAPFCIGLFNQANQKRGGTNLRFRKIGKEGTLSFGFEAYALDSNGDEIGSGSFTLQQAKDASYMDKSQPWKTHTEQMCRYRAATNFVRTTSPEVLSGMREHSEALDMAATGQLDDSPTPAPAPKMAKLTQSTESGPDATMEEMLAEVVE